MSLQSALEWKRRLRPALRSLVPAVVVWFILYLIAFFYLGWWGAALLILAFIGLVYVSLNIIDKQLFPNLFCDKCQRAIEEYACAHCGQVHPWKDMYFKCRCGRYVTSYLCRCGHISPVVGKEHPARDSAIKDAPKPGVVDKLTEERKKIEEHYQLLQLRHEHRAKLTATFARFQANELKRLDEMLKNKEIDPIQHEILSAEIRDWKP